MTLRRERGIVVCRNMDTKRTARKEVDCIWNDSSAQK